ncbi:MAG: SDR family oxidoreductase [Candidatus Lokiarchaeota archaeon]|nr:SDR family oxidoreductase [Candidatus Lokiarchaeota archaeon]MBD3199293.1 SDR family oxidoreductase [Candidatus Lokiarchaeota archaeon]
MVLDQKFLEGKGTLITGGASGFGRGIASAYAKRGSDVVIVDINEDLLNETAKQISNETGQKIIPKVCDVSDSSQVKTMVKEAFSELDNIYILNTNAGIGPSFGKDITRIKESVFNQIININLKGQWLVAKEVSRKMKRQDFEPIAGKIICTASIAGMVVDAGLPIYSISKVGVIALMQLLARSLAPKITCNSMSPGYHVTGIYDNREDIMKMTMDEGHVKTPLNRIGTVEDVVNTSLFLASPLSNFMTGHNVPCDGGIAEVGVPPYYFKSDI